MVKEVDSLRGLKELQKLSAKYQDKSDKSLMDELFEMIRADVAKENTEYAVWLAS